MRRALLLLLVLVAKIKNRRDASEEKTNGRLAHDCARGGKGGDDPRPFGEGVQIFVLFHSTTPPFVEGAIAPVTVAATP